MLVCSADFRRHISIHALREESDRSRAAVCRLVIEFLSTLSVRRATIGQLAAQRHPVISIHALREESDRGLDADFQGRIDFYPRSP